VSKTNYKKQIKMNNQQVTRRRNRKKKVNRRINANRDNRLIRGPKVGRYPKVSRLMQRVTLTYTDNSIIRGASGASYFVYTLRANGLYDPDPLLLTGGISGFTEWGGLYRQYLVESVTVTWDVANAQTFPIQIVFAPSLTNLSTIITSAAAVSNLAENKQAQQRIISGVGGQDRARIKTTINLRSFVANPTQFQSGIYSGFLGAAPSNPTTLIYLNFCGSAPFVFSTGIVASLRVDYHTKLYDVQTPLG